MVQRTTLALAVAAAPLLGLAQLAAQPGNMTMDNMSNGSNVAATMSNDSVDADTPADSTATTTNTTDDGPPK